MSRRFVLRCSAVVAAVSLTGCFDWQQPGFGPEHTNVNPDEISITVEGVASLQQKWTVQSPLDLSQPIIIDGRVFTSTSYPLAGASGARAYDAGTGSILWDRTLAGESPIPLPPSPIAASGEELRLSYLRLIPTFTLAGLDPATGDVVRSQDLTAIPTTGVPLVTSGDVMASVENSSLNGPAQLVVRDQAALATSWTYTFPEPNVVTLPNGGVSGSNPTPTIAHGRIYISNAQTLYAFSASGCGASTCSPLWTHTMTGAHLYTSAGPDGRLFVATSAAGTTRVGNAYTYGQLFAIDGATGNGLWSTDYFGEADATQAVNGSVNAIAVRGDTVYALGYRGHFDPSLDEHSLTAFSAAGCGGQACEQWHADVTGSVLVGAGDVLYVGGPGAIRAFAAGGCDAATCPQLAALDMPDGVSSMAVSDGRLVAMSSPPSGGTTLTAFAMP